MGERVSGRKDPGGRLKADSHHLNARSLIHRKADTTVGGTILKIL